jgi:hypothetical protein
MKMREQQILIAAGFRIFFMEEMSLRIKECTTPGAWSTYSLHRSKAEMERAWAELMNDMKNLEG